MNFIPHARSTGTESLFAETQMLGTRASANLTADSLNLGLSCGGQLEQ